MRSDVPSDAKVIGVRVLLEDPRGGSGEAFITLAEFAKLFMAMSGPLPAPLGVVTPTGSVGTPNGGEG